MGMVKFVNPAELPWTVVPSPSKDLAEVPEAEKVSLEVKVYYSGGEDHPEHPELVEVRSQPGTIAQPHAHDEHEVMYVLEGELEFGQRTYGPGSVIFVEKNTRYAFKVGNQVNRVLLFRPRSGARYIPAERRKRDYE
jgi:quercetin dioxygenase-like cupin family protein